jgi:hypothetical protein
MDTFGLIKALDATSERIVALMLLMPATSCTPSYSKYLVSSVVTAS